MDNVSFLFLKLQITVALIILLLSVSGPQLQGIENRGALTKGHMLGLYSVFRMKEDEWLLLVLMDGSKIYETGYIACDSAQ